MCKYYEGHILHWLELPVLRPKWLDCLRGKAFSISPLNIMIALGFYNAFYQIEEDSFHF